MAHFLAGCEGNRGPASRLGSKVSGIFARAQGWRNGVVVYGEYDPDTEQDVFRVLATGGSAGDGTRRLIATVYPDRIVHHVSDSPVPLEDTRVDSR